MSAPIPEVSNNMSNIGYLALLLGRIPEFQPIPGRIPDIRLVIGRIPDIQINPFREAFSRENINRKSVILHNSLSLYLCFSASL